MNQDGGGDTDLSTPLLEENCVNVDGESASTSSACRNRIAGIASASTDGGVTLHGESLDLRHAFLPGGVILDGDAAPSRKRADEEEEEEEEEDSVDGAGGPRGMAGASSLSLGSFVTTAGTRPPHAASDIARRAITSLSRTGRSLYRAARRLVVTSRRAPRTSRTDVICRRSSLSGSSSTPALARRLIPALVLANHALFYRAQTLPMWNLSYAIDVDVAASADTAKSRAAADVLNLPHRYEYKRRENVVIETFTYMDAIRKLWKGDGLGDARTTSKVAAAMLVVASGIWPHLKLLLLQVCWFLPFAHVTRPGGRGGDGDDDDGDGGGYIRHSRSLMSRRITGIGTTTESGGGGGSAPGSGWSVCCSDGRRRESRTLRSPFLRTLSTLGKWSLADVLVVCILIAVLHLDWDVHPDEIRRGVEDQLPTLLDYARGKFPDAVEDCTSLLKYKCKVGEALVIHYPACFACQTLINNAFSHPEWTAGEGRDILEGITLDGGGYAQLRVMGMSGTYYFCAAVIASILLSMAVDVFDERDRERVEGDLLDRKREFESILAGEDGGGVGSGNELELSEDSNAAQPSGSTSRGGASALDGPPSSPRSYMSATSSRAGDPYARLAGGDAGRSMRQSYVTPSPTTNCGLLKQALLLLLSVSSLPLVLYAVTLPTMQRLVYGGGPMLLHEVLGMIWEKEYSLLSLVKTTGDAGGWDIFLMLTFGLFAVVGPVLRSICFLLHVLLGLPEALLGDCIERPRRRTTLLLALYRATSTFRRALLPVIDALGTHRRLLHDSMGNSLHHGHHLPR
ncbi:hypothetical protein ACHAW5_003702 [Stephanodiscus triporus]|uniref:Uncharacterized protein n=1 Tax=Stephanodiscus triporus TaxID=2934178 RepID=A0ABD3QJK7_9STRA